MRFIETAVCGVYLVELEPRVDERGSFARTFCLREFAACGLQSEPVQANLSHNVKRGTLRGMHYQEEPFAEAKLVQCLRGTVYDVAIDLRPGSETYLSWVAVELEARGGTLLYIPAGCAHGFQTLEDDAALYYLMFNYYEPGYARGVRWDDPAFGIKWPLADPIIAEKDRLWPDYER